MPAGAHRADPDRPWPHPVKASVFGAVGFVSLLGVWFGLVGSLDVADLLIGAGASAVAIGVCAAVSSSGRAVPDVRWADLATVARAVPGTLAETVTVMVAATRSPSGASRSSLRVVPTDAGGGAWPGARRSAVVAALGSLTPGSVVVDVDATTGLATVHELRATAAGRTP